jgi:large subunit ribosomal protein L14
MLQQQSIAIVADNTGAKTAYVIKVPGGSKRRYARIGDTIVCSIKSASPRGTVKRKSIQTAVIVRSTRTIRRKDGTAIRFDDNAVVIIDKDGNPKGTRVFGPIARELREKGYQKIISLAPEVV